MLRRTFRKYSALHVIYLQNCGLQTLGVSQNIKTSVLKAKLLPFTAARCSPCLQQSRQESGSNQQPSSGHFFDEKAPTSKKTELTTVHHKYAINNPYSSYDEEEPAIDKEMQGQQKAKFWASLLHFWRAPPPALLVGLAGLIPFAVPPYYLYYCTTSFYPYLINAQLVYGALILSFVGGIRWGFVVPFREGSTSLVTWRSIIQSVAPPIIAWAGLMMPDLTGGLLVVSVGFGIALYNDLRLFGDYPKWMMGLRCLLTTFVVGLLLASVVFVEENRIRNDTKKRVKSKLLDKEI